MAVKGVILQPNYLPWRGYFDLIHAADKFVFLDDVQYTRRDWRNRNQIKTATGLKWLTVPVKTESRSDLIKDVRIDRERGWEHDHYQTIYHAYSRTPFFSAYCDELKKIYEADWEYLIQLDIALIELVMRWLHINTELLSSSDFNVDGIKEERLISICKACGITHYISGPSGANYIDPQKFASAGIGLEYFEYNYPEYPQLHGDYEGRVSVIDLIFNCGEKSPDYIWKANN